MKLEKIYDFINAKNVIIKYLELENTNAVYFVCDKKEYLVLNSSDFIKK